MSVRRAVAAALTVALCSMLTSTGARAEAAATTPVYVALGDSYSSGEGACLPVVATGCDYRRGSNTSADRCHRSDNAYGVRDAATLPKGWRFVFAACSGATTANVLTAGQYGEPAQIEALTKVAGPGRQVRLVTITIGGNDVGFPLAVGTCVAAHLFLSSSCGGRVTWAISAAQLRARLTAVYAAVHSAAPHARLLVLGYPRLFSADPPASAAATCPVAAVDARAFSKAENAVNADVALAVSQADHAAGSPFASFVDDGTVFDGHELCAGPSAGAYLNGLLLTSSGAGRSESFHPTRVGQAVLAAHLKAALGAAA